MKTFRGGWMVRTAAIAVVAIIGVPVVARAQVGPITNGHALDANPEVGSGGSNTPVPGYVPINPNAIISGNVSGLGYFHGQNNTIAQYEAQDMGNLSTFSMQAPLGTSSLYRFARQSAGAPINSGYQTDYTPYFLPSATVTGENSLGAPVSAVPMNGGFSSNFVPPAAVAPSSRLAPPYGDIGAESQSPNQGVPYRNYDALTNGAVTAPYALPSAPISDLYGFRTVPAGQRVANFNIMNGNTRNKNAAGKARSARTQGRGLRGAGRGNRGLSRGSQPVSGALVPMTGRHNTGHHTRLTYQPGRVRALAAGNRSVRGMASGDLYANLMNSLAARQKRALAYDRRHVQGGLQTYVPGHNPLNHPRGAAPGASTLLAGTNTGTNNGLVNVLPGNAFTKPGRPKPNLAQARRTPGANKKQALRKRRLTTMLQSGRSVGSLSKLYGNAPTPFNQLMRRAQALMRRGKYLRAAGAYQGAITMNPTNALGIVGRANAQLAAGLYESAAYDLKFLFNRHPQLTAVRYKLRAFLPARRIRFLEKDLGALARQQKHSNAGLFLLSYLDYQVHDKLGLQRVLALWKKRQPRSYWPAVLKAAWLAPVHHAKPAPRKKMTTGMATGGEATGKTRAVKPAVKAQKSSRTMVKGRPTPQ